MAITLGAEFALAMHLDQAVSYADLESALVDAGFEDYVITRNVTYDGACDVQFYVRSAQNSDGSVDGLPAAATLQAMTDALSALEPASRDGDGAS